MKLFYLFSLTYLATFAMFLASVPPEEPLEPITIDPYLICERGTYATEIHCLTNQHRESIGSKVLSYSNQAESMAKARAAHLCLTGTFSHDGWEGFIDFDNSRVGENLANRYATPGEAFTALLNSPSHRKNIEDKWDAMGVWTEACDGRNVTAQIFMSE